MGSSNIFFWNNIIWSLKNYDENGLTANILDSKSWLVTSFFSFCIRGRRFEAPKSKIYSVRYSFRIDFESSNESPIRMTHMTHTKWVIMSLNCMWSLWIGASWMSFQGSKFLLSRFLEFHPRPRFINPRLDSLKIRKIDPKMIFQ